MKQRKMVIFLLFSTLIFSSSAMAFNCAWHAISVSFGRNWSDTTRGARISYQFQPSKLYGHAISLYFDLSGAYWHINNSGVHEDMTVAAFAPALRFHPYHGHNYTPFVEASIGGAVLSSTRFAGRRLGSFLLFQDMVGVGINFGSKHQFDFSWRYLHYSDGGVTYYNNGLNVQTLLTFAYHF